MFSESACQVSRRWDDVGRFYTRLFAVMYVMRGDFLRWIRERYSKCASNFVPILGKVLRKPSK